MRKHLYIILVLVILSLLGACSQNDEETVQVEEKTQELIEETNSQTSPLVIENAYLASEEIMNNRVILAIEATNVGDERILIEQQKYELRHKDDETIEFRSVIWDGAGIPIEPDESVIIFNFQEVPEQFDITMFEPSDFQVTYKGVYYDNHPAVPIQTEIPEKYQVEIQQFVKDYKQSIEERESIYAEEYTEEEVSDPIRITGYQLSKNGAMYIRIENLTDEEFYFYPDYLKIYDLHHYYEVDTSVHDSAIGNRIIIPPHGKFEYREFFIISGDELPDKDYILENIMGVLYETEWPLATEYYITGGYEPELPDDFTWEN